MKFNISKSIFNFALITLGLLLAGCPKQQGTPPTPADTMMGSGYTDRADYIAHYQAYQDNLQEGDIPSARSLSTQDAINPDHPLAVIYFHFDNSSIQGDERIKLQATAQYLESHPDQNLLIIGHCDWQGTTEYNLALGERRAKSVRRYLIEIGVHENRLETLSKGDLEASAVGKPSETALDRRSDIILLQR